MPNPRIAPGVLNRVRGAVKITNAPQLNVSASNLAQEGIEFTFIGNVVEGIPAMTGVVQSPQPYIQAAIVVNILRTQTLGQAYKQRWESNGLLGQIRVYSDSTTFGDFDIEECAITSVSDMSFAGGQPGVAITMTGTYYVNSEMWDL